MPCGLQDEFGDSGSATSGACTTIYTTTERTFGYADSASASRTKIIA